MTAPTNPALQLAGLLETLPSDERQELTAWLLNRDHATTPRTWIDFPPGSMAHGSVLPGSMLPGSMAPGSMSPGRPLTSPLATGDTQLVTIRLPAEKHAQLRDWCSAHGFTMAAVVRGLVDQFMEQQGATGTK